VYLHWLRLVLVEPDVLPPNLVPDAGDPGMHLRTTIGVPKVNHLCAVVRRSAWRHGGAHCADLDALALQQSFTPEERLIFTKYDARNAIQHACRRAHDARREPMKCDQVVEAQAGRGRWCAHVVYIVHSLSTRTPPLLASGRPKRSRQSLASCRRLSANSMLQPKAHISACSTFEFF
jgi:hypothetical protein